MGHDGDAQVASSRAEEIVSASPRLACLIVMGTNDLVKDLRAPPHADVRLPMVTCRWASACWPPAPTGLAILDGVYNDIQGHPRASKRGRAVQGVEIGFRRQDADPSEPGRAVQRDRSRRLPPSWPWPSKIVDRLRDRARRRQGRRHGRRPHDREPARRAGAAAARPGRGHPRAGGLALLRRAIPSGVFLPLPACGRAIAYGTASTFPRRGKVAREARRMGDASTNSVSVFDIPHPPFGHLPPPGEGKTEPNRPYAIAVPLAGRGSHM